jgi:hypothetical protein
MQTGDHRQPAFSNGDRANFAICCASLYPALCDAKETRASLKSKLKQINACSSPIFCSERPDMQVISARKAGWTFPIVTCNIRDSKMFSLSILWCGQRGKQCFRNKNHTWESSNVSEFASKHFCFTEANFVSARKFPFKQGIESQMFLQHRSL